MVKSQFLPRDAMHPRYMLWLYVCLCLCVTRRSSTKTAKRRITQTTPHDSPGTLVTIRYDTRCYFNVRSIADMSQLNLPYGTDNYKSVKTGKNWKVKRRICSEVTVNSLENPCSESWKRKRKGCGREDLQKSKDLSLEWKSEWVMEYP